MLSFPGEHLKRGVQGTDGELRRTAQQQSARAQHRSDGTDASCEF